MSDALQTSIARKIRTTPLRDVVRGRLTGRLDVRGRIEASALPEPATRLIARVVRRTRLWKLEQVDVADELIAHFVDGLAAGESVDEMVTSFGDERRAARLIARAKRRARPLPWQAARAVGWLLVALLTGYVALGVYFHAGRPSVGTDYLSALNAAALNAARGERAWPAYRAGLLKLGGRTEKSPQRSLWSLLEVRPGAKRWPQAVAWLDRHSAALEQMRIASAKPSLGFVLGPDGDADDQALWPEVSAEAIENSYGGRRIFDLYQPHMADLRLIGTALAADAALARERGDRGRLVRDIAAVDGLATQVAAEGLWPSEITAVGIRWTAVQAFARALADAPALLHDADLRDLAHRLARPRTGADLFSFSAERMRFEDLLQRTFTDHGDGDGRLTPAGVEVLARLRAGWPQMTGERGDPFTFVASPTTLLLTAGRAEQRRTYERLIGQMAASFRRPMRELPRSPADDEREAMASSSTLSAKYAPVLMMLPQLHTLRLTSERFLALRDGALVAAAVELHRRRAGGYPAELSELSPGLLPAIPLDPVTGSPLKYRIVNGRPLVYSVGADGDDDGGRVPVHPHTGVPAPWTAAPYWGVVADAPADGDWVLYPDPAPDNDPWEEDDADENPDAS